ncbi:conserved hypothetical protein [Leishmania mexicana MHOM/GT/2001/U1103]|uniref:Uncharacterized protein n=1 Tax=Leishmania mexicana (strain MHOM/GT/2001/U1103) TaxID=929439 RepID=E9AR12_LEIMU|nr:conserved hypothetical protein [Leishmania mexicana MHOM/GT/2001/U1103]CBZ25399.1 conserved hypothetical protein [Leishmania mexicana MHOM/GT/2001/U1103]
MMSRLPHFCSDSDFHRDEESSQSMSQVRARPAIRLDTSLSFISTTSIRAGTASGPASPLLGALGGDSINDICISGAAVSSPTPFHTRDVNVEASGQHSLQLLKASHSRAVSDSRSAHSSSRPYSQQQQQPSQSRHHPLSLSLSSCSPSVRRDYDVHSQPRRGGQARCLASEVDGDKLEVLESEATVMTRPSDPRPYRTDADGEPGVCSQRVMSSTVSPAPRHAVTLPSDFGDGLSMPVSEGAEQYDEEASRGRGSKCAARADGRGMLNLDHDAQEDHNEDDAKNMSSATPPPRRAFVLSRRYSSTDVESDARVDDAQAPRSAAEEAERCTPTRMPHVDFAADAPRGSTILVMYNGDEDEGSAFEDGELTAAVIARANAHPPAVAHAPLLEGPAVPLTLPDGLLVPDVVVGEAETGVQHRGPLTPHRAAAAERESASSHSRSLSSAGSSSMMSPFPRPVPHVTQPTAISKRSSPVHVREAVYAVCDDAGSATEQQPQQRAGTKMTLANTTTATAATAASTQSASSTQESGLQATPTIPAQLDAAAALPTAADGGPASVTPLNSFMALNSIAGPSLSATTTAMSSLWLVSGSTPTPLRRLRDRDREVSATLPTQEGEAEETSKGSDTAQAQTERALKLADDASASAMTAPEAGVALHGSAHPCSAPADASIEAEQLTAPAEDAHHHCSSSAPRHTAAHSAMGPAVSAPSFSPEPARPQTEAGCLSSPALAANTAASASVQLNLLSAKDDAVTPGDLQLLPAPEAANTPHRYSTATPPPFATAGTLCRPSETAPSMSSPPSTESARVSEEVRELVRRAQAEVCRTRESLLSALRDHRASFHLSETSPTAKNTLSATAPTPVAQLTATVSTTACASRSVSLTLTRSLPLSTVTVAAAELSTPPSAALKTAPGPTTRTSGEWRSAATALRPHLNAAADAILRRLQGYDARDHGVLPMETVVRVTYFVITRRQMPPATWSLRTAEGTLAATPMRASMVASGGGAATRSDNARLLSHDVEGRRAVLLSGTPLGRQLRSSEAGEPHHRVTTASHKLFETPRQQRLSLNTHDTTARVGGSGSPFLSSHLIGITRPRRCSKSDADADDEVKTAKPECSGRPATCISPSRTLEHVMMLQHRRSEEELYLQFYFTVLEAFKQVFGERYAWRHLGATNASRHDCAINVAQPPQKRRRTSSAAPPECSDLRGHAHVTATEADAEQTQLEVVNEFNNVTGPLETLFPRLRQQYALLQRERRGDAAAAPNSIVASTGDSLTVPRTTSESVHTEAAAAAMGLAHRPPPLDVLVYYRKFIESLKEL